MALVTEQMVERATKKLDDMYGPLPRPIVTSTIRDILTAALSAEPEAVPAGDPWEITNDDLAAAAEATGRKWHHKDALFVVTVRDRLRARVAPPASEAVPVAWVYMPDGHPGSFYWTEPDAIEQTRRWRQYGGDPNAEAVPVFLAPPASSREAELVGMVQELLIALHAASRFVVTDATAERYDEIVARARALLREIDAAVADKGGER